jgi:hypothetical protein
MERILAAIVALFVMQAPSIDHEVLRSDAAAAAAYASLIKPPAPAPPPGPATGIGIPTPVPRPAAAVKTKQPMPPSSVLKKPPPKIGDFVAYPNGRWIFKEICHGTWCQPPRWVWEWRSR